MLNMLDVLNVMDFVLILVLCLCISCILFNIGAWLTARIAEYFRHEAHNPDTEHEGPGEC
jgi:hypothetical protein